MRHIVHAFTSFVTAAVVVAGISASSYAQVSGAMGNAPPRANTGDFSLPMITRGESQDTQFLALIRARDGQYASVNELRRIIAYHDNFRPRIERAFADYPPPLTREFVVQTIAGALEGLKKFEEEIRNEADLAKVRDFTERYDSQFPVSFSRSAPQQNRVARPIEFGRDPRFSLGRERSALNEVFQNISIENRVWLARYEKLLKMTDEGLMSIEERPPLRNVPLGFNELVQVPQISIMTKDQVLSAIAKYRAMLQEGSTNYQPSSTAATSLAELKPLVLSEADKIAKDLSQTSSEANAQFQNLEKNIASTARSLYGNKVGADSFNYLLIVFAAVFGIIMLIPRLYKDSNIALNLLKAEFLLQFSTVFVLVAAIIILGIGELIAKDQLPVLLAGISGYVLGQLGKPDGTRDTRNAGQQQQQPVQQG
jgi:hypothetical protein